jgi:uncharacterized protein
VLVDANILLYALDRRSPFHAPAKGWLETQLNGRRRVGFAWDSLVAFLRISTNPRLSERPLTSSEAIRLVEGWLAAPPAWIPQPTEDHLAVLASLIETHQLTSDLMPDAHLAALAIEHGLVVISADTDFARFGEIRWENPLSAKA